jgi:hypothetical protein
VVDRQDAAILLRNLGRTDALGQAVDLDGDGNVGLSDLAVIQSRLGVGVPSPTAVPEPSTVLLVLVSVASTAATRVRRRRVQWKRA